MELRHIRYFLVVAEERHFTRAAAKIGIGQPPLSQQIKDLEAEIGASLFRRVAHGAELTTAGEAFLQAVKEMPVLAERATRAARRAARGETGSLASASQRQRSSTRRCPQLSALSVGPMLTLNSCSKRPAPPA